MRVKKINPGEYTVSDSRGDPAAKLFLSIVEGKERLCVEFLGSCYTAKFIGELHNHLRALIVQNGWA